MHIPAAWVLLALPSATPPPVPPPDPTVPVPIAESAVAEPPDEEVLKDGKAPSDGPGLIEFFRQRVVHASDEGRIQGLIRQLGDDEFEKREDASLQLCGLGLRAKGLLEKALDDPDPEIAHRAGECLKQIDEGSASATTAAAIRLLARRKPDGAASALLDFLPAAGEEELVEQARLALADLAVRDGKADPALVRALGDASALKRGAAAFALGRSAVADQLPAVRKMQQDPDPLVRYHAGMALAAAGEKSAVPALIDLLDLLPRREASRVEELLYRIADGKGPEPSALDREERRKYRDAWRAWWNDAAAKVDADRLAEAARTNGFTLIILLDQGRVVELDSANHVRLDVGQLNFPLDAQLLPDDHVLAAEHNGNRVTERDATGKVVWEQPIDMPLAAQRLPNGNTFIATQQQLIEVKPDGTEVSSYSPPTGEVVMKAQKLADGKIAMVVQAPTAVGTATNARFVLLDAKSKEERTFSVALHYSGGRIDVLPNGNVLIPEADDNRVVELDPRGNLVWEAPADQPIAAVRLANGDTLVTTFADHRAIELDRDGHVVWEARRDSRVTRAFRR